MTRMLSEQTCVPFPSEACLPGRVEAARKAQRGQQSREGRMVFFLRVCTAPNKGRRVGLGERASCVSDLQTHSEGDYDMKRARDDPSYDLVQWAMRNRNSLFRRFFAHHTDITPLTCEMQYAVKQISGAAPKRLYSGGKYSGVHLGFIDLVVYNPDNTRPDHRIDNIEAWQRERAECIYIKVEPSPLPPMDELMRRLQRYYCHLSRVSKGRIVLLCPPCPPEVAEDVRKQGFGCVECADAA